METRTDTLRARISHLENQVNTLDKRVEFLCDKLLEITSLTTILVNKLKEKGFI